MKNLYNISNRSGRTFLKKKKKKHVTDCFLTVSNTLKYIKIKALYLVSSHDTKMSFIDKISSNSSKYLFIMVVGLINPKVVGSNPASATKIFFKGKKLRLFAFK